MQPVKNQYNISDKIKEANQQLFVNESTSQRQSQPKVRFRDHKLVDYEPEDGNENMENLKNQIDHEREGESSDDGYIDDEVEHTSIEEIVEIEDVIELIDPDEESENMEKELNTENRSNEDFHDAHLSDQALAAEGASSHVKCDFSSTVKAVKATTIFRPKSSKINPCRTSPASQQKFRKICCEFKETDEYKQKLPKYNGFNSNYGLSKEEISKREHVQLKQRQHKELRTIKQMEQREFLASLNEEAFSKWYVSLT